MISAFSKIKTKQLKMESVNRMRKHHRGFTAAELKSPTSPGHRQGNAATETRKRRQSLKTVKYVNIYSPTLFLESLKFVHNPNRMELTSCFCGDKESKTKGSDIQQERRDRDRAEQRDREMTEGGRRRREMKLETDTQATCLPPEAAALLLWGPQIQDNRSARGWGNS